MKAPNEPGDYACEIDLVQERVACRDGSAAETGKLFMRGLLRPQGSANTKMLFPELGCSSGVSRPSAAEVIELPVLTATYCFPSTA